MFGSAFTDIGVVTAIQNLEAVFIVSELHKMKLVSDDAYTDYLKTIVKAMPVLNKEKENEKE